MQLRQELKRSSSEVHRALACRMLTSLEQPEREERARVHAGDLMMALVPISNFAALRSHIIFTLECCKVADGTRGFGPSWFWRPFTRVQHLKGRRERHCSPLIG